MFHIVVAILLGATVGFLFARYVFCTPSRSTKTFGSFLKRYGPASGFAIGAPIIAYLTLFEQPAHKDVCLIAYFLSLLITMILTIAFVGWLVISSVISHSVRPEVLKACRRHYLLMFCFRGYPAIEKEFQAIENMVKKLSNNEVSPQNISEEEKRLCDELTITPKDLKQIFDAARRHLRD